MRGILIFIIVFGILVFVHEFGHFFVAKKSGILVREFSIGMGPKLFQTRKQKTTYTIRWLPLGGYVRLAGSDDIANIDPGTNVILKLNEKQQVVQIDASESELPIAGTPVRVTQSDLVDQLTITGYENGDESSLKTFDVDHDATIIDQTGTELIIAPRDTQFQSAKLWQKIATNVAGPLMNIVLGFVVFLIWTFIAAGPTTTSVAKIQSGSPAAQAQIKKGDQIIAINQHKVANFDEVVQAINQSKGQKLVVELKRGSIAKTMTVKPKKVAGRYQIGILAARDNSFSTKLNRGLSLAISTTGLIFNAVGDLFKHFSLNKLSGPVGIYSQTAQVSQLGFEAILIFLAMISINLGIVNLIPIPGLDGGKLLLNLVELVRGKPLKPEHEAVVDLIGVALLLILIIAVTGNDIYRYFIR